MDAKEVLEFIKERRTYRQFEDKQITDEQLQMILEAGLYAPNAGSRQSCQFLVIQDQEVNEKLGKINRNVARIAPGRHVNHAQPSIIDDPNMKSGFYGAPTVITLLAPKNFLYSEADCAVAAENMLLMAHALGLGGCLVARAQQTMDSPYGKELLEKNNVSDNYIGFFHVLIGYPQGKTFLKDRASRVIYCHK